MRLLDYPGSDHSSSCEKENCGCRPTDEIGESIVNPVAHYPLVVCNKHDDQEQRRSNYAIDNRGPEQRLNRIHTNEVNKHPYERSDCNYQVEGLRSSWLLIQTIFKSHCLSDGVSS